MIEQERRPDRPPLYCPPRRLAINTEQHIDILRRYVEQNPDIGRDPIGLAMLLALQHTFPCKD
jgi:hypothetical protein